MKPFALIRGMGEQDPRFTPCKRCGESYSGLEGYPAFGVCYDCQAVDRAEKSAPSRGQWLESCGVPSKYARDFSEVGLSKKAHEALAWATAQDSEGLVLFGATGVGKSYLAAEIAWRMRLVGTRWVRSSDAVAIEVGGDNSARQEIHRAPLLVVDDFGKGSTGGAWSILSELLCCRCENVRLRTVITTNLGSADIPDPALVDRLRDWTGLAIVGKSRRGLLQNAHDSC